MDDTGRAFKVVSAGLQNVQRVARAPNTPVAQLGDPVEIGPFLTERDRAAAHDMIERPLRALGWKPDGPEVTARILADANYYPSLIQLVGRRLVDDLDRDRA